MRARALPVGDNAFLYNVIITSAPTRECYNQKDCKGVAQSKELSESATIKITTRNCQKNCKGVPQTKELQGSAAIKTTVREIHNQKELPGSATIKKTARKWQNQKNCQEVLQ